MIFTQEQSQKMYDYLTELEDVISGLEAEADNAGINCEIARYWWADARKLLNVIEEENGI